MNTNELIEEKLAASMNYTDYIQLLEDLFAEGKTTGKNQSEAMLEYASLNLQRMRRIQKTYHVSEETLSKLSTKNHQMIWLVITEGWCGDAAQNIPILNKLAEAIEGIDLQLILRDEHLDLMDQFLTEGSRSIPKLIAVDKNSRDVLFTWGPRPAVAQQMMVDQKHNPTLSSEEFKKSLHLWYARDKGASTEKELVDLIL